MNGERGFVWLLALPVIAAAAILTHQIVHHNEPNSDHLVLLASDDLGCQSMAECSAAPIPEPASGLLVAVGGLVVGYAVRRQA